MKKLINLGKSLTKEEQKTITGGYGECIRCSATTCSSDSDCSRPSGNCICYTGTGKCGLKTATC